MFRQVKNWASRLHSDDARLIRRILEDHARPNWKSYLVVLVLGGMGAGCTALAAYILGTVVDRVYLAKDAPAVVATALAGMVVFTGRGLATYAQFVKLAIVSIKISADCQIQMFDKLLKQPVTYFSDRHSSEFSARLLYGASSISEVLRLIITAIARDGLTLIALTTVILVRAPFIALIAIVAMPVGAFLIRTLIRRVREIAMTQFGASTRILESLQETLHGLQVVKAFNLQSAMLKRFSDSVRSTEAASIKLAKVSHQSTPTMEALGGISVGLILMYGGYSVLELGALPGDFVSFVAAFLLAYEPAKRLARLNIELSNSLLGARVVYDLLDTPNEPTEGDKPNLPVSAGRIEFINVHFGYQPGLPVLRDVSLTAEPGQLTALVGASGGGKSTMLKLILRFYDPDEGRVVIDGTDIREASRTSVREAISYVGQNTFLFRGTVRDNIAVGRLDATDDQIVSAAKAAYAHEFISALPQQYNTPVGEHGANLSGGQRQRIAVARALIRNTPIVLLDEPTESLDSESESYVHEAISQLFENRTRLVIAHRLHTILRANRICVVENGAIVEVGEHHDLLQRGGRYATLFNLQFKRQIENLPQGAA
jgi:ABC-type multidrug transport system fused ATPase/permease subunit